MTSALIKKTNKKSFSSLSTKYVENFVSRVEDKLFDFNKTFFSPYKKKLDELDKSVITDIEKNLSSPALLVKNQLDELWNYHWMLGQTDVLSNRNKKSNLTSYSSNHTNLITFATQEDLAVKGMWDAKVEKAILKDYDRRVTRLQRDLTKATNVDKKGISAQLQDISRELEQFLGKIQNRQATATTKQFATIGVRVRDLQETVRVMELKLSEGTSSISSPTDIDILNSSQFGTIYQDKRTLLLGQSYAGDYKKGIISSIKKYFANNEGIRPKTRERDLFTQLTKNTSTNISKEEVSRVKTLTSSRDRLSNKDRLAAQAVQQFISSVSKGRSLTDKKIQQFIKGDSSDSSINKLISATQNTIYEDNASRLVDEIRNIGTNEGSYSTNIKPLLQEIKNREKYPLGDNVERVFDTRSNSYRRSEERRVG